MNPRTTRQQSRSTYDPKSLRPGNPSNPHTNATTNTGHPIGKYLIPANPNLPNVQQVVRDPSNGRPPTLPQSGTRLTAPQIQGDGRPQPSSSGRIPYGHPHAEWPYQAVPQTVPDPDYEYEIPLDSASDSDNDDVEPKELGPFEPERSHHALDHDKVFEGNPYIPPSLEPIANSTLLRGAQFAGSALPPQLASLHQSTMPTSRGPWLPAGSGNPPYQEQYNHNVIGLPQESFQQAPVPHMPYAPPDRNRLMIPGAPYSGLPEPQPPRSQRHIAPTQRNTGTENAGDNLKNLTLREELYSSRPKLFSTLAKLSSIEDRVQIVESSENYNEAQDLLTTALRHWEKQGSRPSLMLCMFFLLTPFNPDEQFVRQFIPTFEADPPVGPLSLELKWLWSRCLARRNEINEKISDPTLRNKMFDFMVNQFPPETLKIRRPDLKRPRMPNSTASQSQTDARAGFPRVHHPK